MRFMVIVKASKDTEAGVMPGEELLTEMTRFNQELVDAGVMLAGDGLHPSAKGARVKFDGDQRTVERGPFANPESLVAGWWVIQAGSLDEAIDWMKRCPNPTGEQSELEIRQIFDAADFGEAFTPELQEAEERMREQLAARA